MAKRLNEKLGRMRAGTATSRDFIIADAKDADMAFGVTAPGPSRGKCRHGFNESEGCWKTLPEYLEQIRAIVRQDIVDIVLVSASNLERLAIDEGLFANSKITPAARANDTSDIWAVRGGKYAALPSRSFRTATLDHIKYGRIANDHTAPTRGADLGLYSITFTNDLDWDHRALEDFHAFRIEAERKQFRYFLEVFNPNVDPGFEPRKTGAFLNDHIVRTLAGVTAAGRPLFLKMPYNGPGPLEELVSYDPNLVVGILGGSAGTTLDAFQLLHDAKKHGARVALFGRKINLSEHPLAFVEFLRRIADDEIQPVEAVKAYHAVLQNMGLKPARALHADLQATSQVMRYR
ncbi:MAG: hypothetical protein HY736_06875 [Verrucomicrobia bacterium]|nr:hypothetical protein [Verrucomicrobiota bacterium]